ncbi:MAG: GNAT family N-acetyltransferase [Clostridiales bacterium]|nr:GNAT family N-acetyltransferase [Clostridiales bacterium]
MNFEKMYLEEDLFPKEITSYEKRDYGFLFYNEENKDSFDSNHAIIYREKIHDIEMVLNDIINFYRKKGIRPNIYQSIGEEGYFNEIKRELSKYGFEYWTEEQKYMVLSEKNTIIPNPKIVVKKATEWEDEYGIEIFEKAGEPWEIDVAKKALMNSNTLFFVAYYKEIPVGMTHCHLTDGICRADYLLVSKEYRNIGVGRALIYSFVEYCHTNQIDNCYLWPDGESAEKIYYEAGFRHVETKQTGRATIPGCRGTDI